TAPHAHARGERRHHRRAPREDRRRPGPRGLGGSMFANTQMMGIDTGFPDVCLTPAPPAPAPVPIPYPNIGAGPTASPAVYNVLFMYTPAHNMSTKTAMSN